MTQHSSKFIGDCELREVGILETPEGRTVPKVQVDGPQTEWSAARVLDFHFLDAPVHFVTLHVEGETAISCNWKYIIEASDDATK